jgi:hypothetical protein
MTNPTSNFGWQMPTSTDLVTDLPADFEVFGQAVDTDFVDLLGGTTGQVLSKTSNTDLDFTWVAANPGDITGVTAGTGISGGGTSGTVTVSIDTAVTADLTTSQTLTNKTLTSPALTTPTISTLTTNGDLLYGTGSGALARKAIGSTGQVLTVAAGIPSWATPSAGAVTQITTGSFSAVTSTSVNNCFTSTYKNYTIILQVASDTYVNNEITFRYRGAGTDGTANSYYGGYLTIAQNGTWTTHFVNPSTSAPLFRASDTAHQAGVTGTLTVNDPLTSGYGRPIYVTAVDTSNANTPISGGFNYVGTITADGFTLLFSAAATGTYKIYGWSN